MKITADASVSSQGRLIPAQAVAGRGAWRSRRRWSRADLRCLESWAGTLLVGDICHRLRRTERAIRCQMHRLDLSAKVREGCGLEELHAYLHLSPRATRRHLMAGTLRVHSALVCVSCGTSAPQAFGKPMIPRLPSTIGAVCNALRRSRRWIVAAANAGHCRLTHLRVSEASVFRLARNAEFAIGRAPIDPLMRLWLRGDP